FLGLGLSDAIVVRNVGGRVTPEVINDVAFIGQIAEGALPEGPLFEVAVIHHTQCGAGALADETFRRRYAERIGADESALRDRAGAEGAQRGADLAALSAVRSMRDDLPRLVAPARLPDGGVNPRHLGRPTYLARAIAAAREAASRNGLDPSRVSVAFPDSRSI